MPEGYYTLAEAVKKTGFGDQQLLQMARDGTIDLFQRGLDVMFRTEQIDALVNTSDAAASSASSPSTSPWAGRTETDPPSGGGSLASGFDSDSPASVPAAGDSVDPPANPQWPIQPAQWLDHGGEVPAKLISHRPWQQQVIRLLEQPRRAMHVLRHYRDYGRVLAMIGMTQEQLHRCLAERLNAQADQMASQLPDGALGRWLVRLAAGAWVLPQSRRQRLLPVVPAAELPTLIDAVVRQDPTPFSQPDARPWLDVLFTKTYTTSGFGSELSRLIGQDRRQVAKAVCRLIGSVLGSLLPADHSPGFRGRVLLAALVLRSGLIDNNRDYPLKVPESDLDRLPIGRNDLLEGRRRLLEGDLSMLMDDGVHDASLDVIYDVEPAMEVLQWMGFAIDRHHVNLARGMQLIPADQVQGWARITLEQFKAESSREQAMRLLNELAMAQELGSLETRIELLAEPRLWSANLHRSYWLTADPKPDQWAPLVAEELQQLTARVTAVGLVYVELLRRHWLGEVTLTLQTDQLPPELIMQLQQAFVAGDLSMFTQSLETASDPVRRAALLAAVELDNTSLDSTVVDRVRWEVLTYMRQQWRSRQHDGSIGTWVIDGLYHATVKLRQGVSELDDRLCQFMETEPWHRLAAGQWSVLADLQADLLARLGYVAQRAGVDIGDGLQKLVHQCARQITSQWNGPEHLREALVHLLRDTGAVLTGGGSTRQVDPQLVEALLQADATPFVRKLQAMHRPSPPAAAVGSGDSEWQSPVPAPAPPPSPSAPPPVSPVEPGQVAESSDPANKPLWSKFKKWTGMSKLLIMGGLALQFVFWGF